MGFAKTPTKNIKTQSNHFKLFIVVYLKLEWLNKEQVATILK